MPSGQRGKKKEPESLADGREKRATAGKRMHVLVGEELENDESFWGDEKWNEDDIESEYSDESASEDEIDSDFDESEDEEDEDEDSEAERQAAVKDKKRKVSKYKEPTKRRAIVSTTAHLTAEEVEKLRQERREAARLKKELDRLAPVERSKRASTQQKTEATQEALADRVKQPTLVRAPRISKCDFTQEELLVEACATEQDNIRWLLGRKRLQNESEVSSHAPKGQVKLVSRFISRRGCHNCVNFPEVDLMPDIFKNPSLPTKPPQRGAKCVVTGLPAKYRDPRTGHPYANLEAFRILRSDPQYQPVESDLDDEADDYYDQRDGGDQPPQFYISNNSMDFSSQNDYSGDIPTAVAAAVRVKTESKKVKQPKKRGRPGRPRKNLSE